MKRKKNHLILLPGLLLIFWLVVLLNAGSMNMGMGSPSGLKSLTIKVGFFTVIWGIVCAIYYFNVQ